MGQIDTWVLKDPSAERRRIRREEWIGAMGMSRMVMIHQEG